MENLLLEKGKSSTFNDEVAYLICQNEWIYGVVYAKNVYFACFNFLKLQQYTPQGAPSQDYANKIHYTVEQVSKSFGQNSIDMFVLSCLFTRDNSLYMKWVCPPCARMEFKGKVGLFSEPVEINRTLFCLCDDSDDDF